MNIFQSSASALLVLLTAAAIAPANAATGLSNPPSDATPSAQLISQVGVLRLDSRGEAVTLLQQQLTTLGYFSGVATGFFGPVTEDAVRRFQRDAGLTADGIVGAGTDAAIQQRLTPPAAPAPTSGVLRLNDTGEQVSELQRRLTALGYFSGPVTGTFGPLTQTAVISFQQANGLTADGIVGAGTSDALRRATVPQTPTVRPPDPAPSGSLLRRGDTGTRVADLQSRLRQLRFYNGAVNGNFGQNTEDAVRAFQRSQGLPDDGIAGPEVNSSLERLTSASSNPGADTPTTTASNAPEQNIQDAGTYEGVDRYSVAELQRRLQSQGNYTGEENNVLTPATREGIAEAQQEHGLKPGDLAR
jgi:peptidoglycan hydrolase-like protein with peptidoglycan-binding domain